MIRDAIPNDIVKLKEIYNKSFNYEPNDLDYIFDNCLGNGYCKVNELNNKLLSSLFLIPVTMCVKQSNNNYKKYFGNYIYGACTNPEYRGKGHMSALLNYCNELTSGSNDFNMLAIEDKSLQNFYSRLDYEPVWYSRVKNFNITELSDNNNIEIFPLTKQNLINMISDNMYRGFGLYTMFDDNVFYNYFYQSIEHYSATAYYIKYSILESQTSFKKSGFILRILDNELSNQLIIKDSNIPEQDLLKISKSLCRQLSCEKIKYRYFTPDITNHAPICMIKKLNDNFKINKFKIYDMLQCIILD